MTADEKNAYIMKYISNLMGKLKENGINFTEEQKREIFTKYLDSDKSLEEIKEEINETFKEIAKYYTSDSQYNEDLYIPEGDNDPLVTEPNARTLRKTPPKFGTIDSGYSHMFIISLIVIIIILLVVIYLAYLSVNK